MKSFNCRDVLLLSEDESIDSVSIQGAGGLSSSRIDNVRFEVGGMRSWPRRTTAFFIPGEDFEHQSLFWKNYSRGLDVFKWTEG